MPSPRTKVGIIGCGVISGIYIETLQKMANVEIAAIADVWREAAEARATQYGIERILTVEELLADPEIAIVINLTVPRAHAEVALQVLRSSKHVYNEKPLSTSLADARQVLDVAAERGLVVGCAPDTVLGGGIQTCRALIDEGAIGQPVAAVAFMMHRGPEGFRPGAWAESPTRRRIAPKDPSGYFQPGVGPMFDMGPYYLHSLALMLGPARRVTGSARITYPERRPHGGEPFKVNTETYISGVIDHVGGAISTIITTTDVWPTGLPRIEIYGSEGSLQVPDPNTWGGPVRLRRAFETEWTEVAVERPYTRDSRGLGVADLASAVAQGRQTRASGELAYHVTEIMHGLHTASREGRHVDVASTFARPPAMPADLAEGEID